MANKTFEQREADVRNDLAEKEKAARKARRDANRKLEQARRDAIVDAVLNGEKIMSFKMDNFLDLMAGEEGKKFYKNFSACYTNKPKKNDAAEELNADNHVKQNFDKNKSDSAAKVYAY